MKAPKPLKAVLIAVCAVVAIGLIGWAAGLGGKPAAPVVTDASPAPKAATPTAGTAQDTLPGSYVDYRPGIVAETSGTKVLFFYAPWCPQCRQLEKSIKEGTIPMGTTIINVDYDSNQALRKEYGVTIQTTLVKVDDSGKLVKRYVAYDEPTLDALQRNLLP